MGHTKEGRMKKEYITRAEDKEVKQGSKSKKTKYGDIKNPVFVENYTKLLNFIALFSEFNLNPRELRFMIWRFFNDLTYRQMALADETSYQNVEQIVKKICRNIKKHVEKFPSDKIEDFNFLLQNSNSSHNH